MGRFVSVVIALLTLTAMRYAEDYAFLLKFDHYVMPPNASCDGAVEVINGELIEVTPVLFEPGDEVNGNSWHCTIQGTPQQPGKRQRVTQMHRTKGIVIKLRGTENTVIALRTKQGNASVKVGDIPWHTVMAICNGRFKLQRVPFVERITGTNTEDEFPAIICDSQGRLWVAWQSWDGKADKLLVACRDGRRWSKPISVTDRPGDYYQPRLATDGEGRLWVVWAGNDGGNWDLWARYMVDERWSPPMQLTNTPGTDFHHKLTTSPNGSVWLAWQSERNGQYDIFVAQLTESGLTKLTQVTTHPANDWEPDITIRKDGTIFIAWDTYRNGSYDVYVKRLSRGHLSMPIPIACTPDYEAHASIACDNMGRLWIAWDNGGPNWGRHGKPRLLLHSRRRVEIACLDDAGNVSLPTQPIASCLSEELKGLWELPHITFDEAGRLIVLFRHLASINRWLVAKRRKEGQSRGIWCYFVTCYDGRAWSHPMLLAQSNGRNDQRPAMAFSRNGTLWIAYAGDGRQRYRAEVPLNNNVFVCHLKLNRMQPVTLPTIPMEKPPAPYDLREPPRKPFAIIVGNKKFQLLYGDTHRHTDLSRCLMNYDGSLLDTYRYAIDVVKLDFIGISDHDQDILKHRYDRIQRPLQGYIWWLSEKMCDLMFMGSNFISLYGYEHGGSMIKRGGHKNIMYAKRGMPVIEDDAPEDLFRALEGKDAIAIPHQLADGGSATDWSKWSPKWEPVAEIFQTRGSYEYIDAPRVARVKRRGHYIWDALAQGVKVGIIASSDHGLTHGAYAGVYVVERTRHGVLEGMRARHTFGATDTIVLVMQIGDHLMGEEIEVRSAPRIIARIIGTGELKRVDIIRNNRFVYTFDPQGSSYTFTFTDTSLSPGQSAYYYLRCIQENDEMAWSSPIWVSWRD